MEADIRAEGGKEKCSFKCCGGGGGGGSSALQAGEKHTKGGTHLDFLDWLKQQLTQTESHIWRRVWEFTSSVEVRCEMHPFEKTTKVTQRARKKKCIRKSHVALTPPVASPCLAVILESLLTVFNLVPRVFLRSRFSPRTKHFHTSDLKTIA